MHRVFALALAFLPITVFAFNPSTTTPKSFVGCLGCGSYTHHRVDDGNHHSSENPDCGYRQEGTVWACSHNTVDCKIGYSPGQPLTAPRLRFVNGNQLEVEYWARNAYCNPDAAGSPPDDVPIEQNYRVTVWKVDPITYETESQPVAIIGPYWEHGKVTLISGIASCFIYWARYEKLNSETIQYFIGSNMVGPTGQEASGRSCLAETHGCEVSNNGGAPTLASNVAKPINTGSGNMRYEEPLFAIAENTAPLPFGIAYNSRNTSSGPLGYGFTHTFSDTIGTHPTSPSLRWRRNARGEITIYSRTVDPTGEYWTAVWPSGAAGVLVVGSTSSITELDGSVTTYDTAGKLLSRRDRWGNTTTLTYLAGNLSAITDPSGRIWSVTHDVSNRLAAITDPETRVWAFGYDGSGRLDRIADPLHTLVAPWRTYSYVVGNTNEPAVLASVADDSGAVLEGHQYDSAGRATSSWSGDTLVPGGIPQPGPNARDLVTLTYNSATQTTVTTKLNSTTNLVSVFALENPAGRFRPTSITGNCPSCSGGSDDAQTFSYDDFNRIVQKTVGENKTGSGGTDERVSSSYTYNDNGMLLTRTDAVGKPEQRTTTYAYARANWPSFVTSIVEASAAKPGSDKTTTFSWNTAGTPESILTTTISGYLESTDTTATSLTTTTTYDAKHRVLEVSGPNANQKTTYTYYADGDLLANRRGRMEKSLLFTSATATLQTLFDEYDLYGTARKIVDANGAETILVTDAKGRVTSSTSKKPPLSSEPNDYVTSSTFDTRDRLSAQTRPSGNKIVFEYENGTNWLTGTIRADASGNQRERLKVTFNTAGSKVLEEAQKCATPANPCAVWTTRRSEAFTYDSHGRLGSIVHPDASTIVHTYDSRGNLTHLKDERHTAANTIYGYDPLNRLETVTQKQTIVPGPDIVTEYGYDVHDNLTSVTDPNGNITTYNFDDFSRMQKQISPVTGTTTYDYDAAGNLYLSTDANGATTTRFYDDANRITSASSARSGYTTEVVTWTYDSPTASEYGKGRLHTMTDPSGSTGYAYERRGLLVSENRFVGSTNLQQSYLHDADGNRTEIGYPSGRRAVYTVDHAGRPASVTSRVPPDPFTTYVSSAAYEPFGPPTSIVLGNGTTMTRSYDTRYRLETNKLLASSTTLADYFYVNDVGSNVTTLADLLDASYNRVFVYDDLSRLTNVTVGTWWGSGSFTYDKMGNIETLALSAPRSTRAASFDYSSTTPKLDSVTEDGTLRQVTTDASGNELSYNNVTRTYSPRNLMSSFSMPFSQGAFYTYDGRSVRVKAVGDNLSLYQRLYSYTPELSLLSIRETIPFVYDYDVISFGGMPVASVQRGHSAATRYIFTDHLGTPVMETDPLGVVTAQVEYEPYGNVWQFSVGDASTFTLLRFPGQFVSESDSPNGAEERYNIFRSYRSGWGRYTQSDPIGLDGGLNLFSYASGAPTTGVDPLGLKTCVIFTRDTKVGMPYVSHTALWSDGKCKPGGGCEVSDPFLYDPAGSYQNQTRGSGGMFMGEEASLDDYLKYHRDTGSEVEVYCFETSCCDQKEIADRAESIGDPRGFSCAASVSSCLSGVGAFRGVTPTRSPGKCRTQVMNSRRRNGRSGGASGGW